MNQIATRRAPPLSGPAAGIGDLSRMDLSDSEVVKDAEHELRHCQSDHDFARWARRWGERAVVRLQSVSHLDEYGVTSEEHSEVETERDEYREAYEAVSKAATEASLAVAKVLAGSKGEKTDAIQEIMSALDTAIEDETQ